MNYSEPEDACMIGATEIDKAIKEFLVSARDIRECKHYISSRFNIPVRLASLAISDFRNSRLLYGNL